MARKSTIEQEAYEAIRENHEIATETATIIETDNETIYQSPQEEPAESPFANILGMMEESGMIPEDDIPAVTEEEEREAFVQDVQEQSLVSYSFPTPEQLDLSRLPEADSPEGNEPKKENVTEIELEELSAEELFPDDMSVDEIAAACYYMAESDIPIFIKTPEGDEIEVIQETEKDITEREENQKASEEPENSKKEQSKDQEPVKEDKKRVNIYLNGRPVTEEQFKAHISEHKALYVAALRDRYPAVKKAIAKDVKRQEQLKKGFAAGLTTDGKTIEQSLGRIRRAKATEKDLSVIAVLKDEHQQGQTLETPAEAAKKMTDVEAKLMKAKEEVKVDELTHNKERLLSSREGAISVEVNFIGYNGTVEHNARIARNRDGEVSMRLDGRKTSEGKLREIVDKYPGMLKAAVDFKLQLEEKDKGKDR